MKTIMRDGRQSIKHACKAHFVFESDLIKKLKTDWKGNVFRQFSISNCRQQLFSLNSVDLLYFKRFGILCFTVGYRFRTSVFFISKFVILVFDMFFFAYLIVIQWLPVVQLYES